MMFRVVFWDILPCKIIADNIFTLQYIQDDNSEHHIAVLRYVYMNGCLSRGRIRAQICLHSLTC
jgi:hypothetical protein